MGFSAAQLHVPYVVTSGATSESASGLKEAELMRAQTTGTLSEGSGIGDLF